MEATEAAIYLGEWLHRRVLILISFWCISIFCLFRIKNRFIMKNASEGCEWVGLNNLNNEMTAHVGLTPRQFDLTPFVCLNSWNVPSTVCLWYADSIINRDNEVINASVRSGDGHQRAYQREAMALQSNYVDDNSKLILTASDAENTVNCLVDGWALLSFFILLILNGLIDWREKENQWFHQFNCCMVFLDVLLLRLTASPANNQFDEAPTLVRQQKFFW